MDRCDYQGFIFQPFGIRKSPDIILIAYGKSLYVELKSAYYNGFQLNSGRPRPDTVFIFHRKRDGKSKVLLGKQLLDPEDKEQFEIEWKSKVEPQAASISFKKSIVKSAYCRPMFFLPSLADDNIIDGDYEESLAFDYIRSI